MNDVTRATVDAIDGDVLPREGDVIDGEFRIERRLAAGAMGVVFEATQLSLGRPVALKVIRPELLSRPESVARFLREARACARVAHPNVVQVFAAQARGTRAYLAMELLHGESLAARIARAGPLSLEEATRVATEVLDGLGAVHREGVVHRDVKPENVFLATSDGAARAVVVDFGVARLPTSDETPSMTREGGILGTPGYMSPEQVRGEIDIDARSDVYAVGATLYEMLAGAAPFEGRTGPAVYAAIVRGECPRLRDRAPGVSPSLVVAVERAMTTEREGRFGSASEFAAALRSIAFDATLPALVTPRPSSLGTPRRHHPRSRAAGLGVVALAVAVLAVATARRGGEVTGPRPPREIPGLRDAVGTAAEAQRVAPQHVEAQRVAPSLPHPVNRVARNSALAPRAQRAASAMRVVVRTEEGARVGVHGGALDTVAVFRRPRDLAVAELVVAVMPSRVCCQIPHEDRIVCAPVRVNTEGEGHANCFAP